MISISPMKSTVDIPNKEFRAKYYTHRYLDILNFAFRSLENPFHYKSLLATWNDAFEIQTRHLQVQKP